MVTTREHLTAMLADRYHVERELGAGGMATVYLAHDIKHDRKVALKVLKPELSAVVGAERFLVEIRTTANLQHPHILSLFDSGSVQGTVFYVMPFVEGETLRARLDREGQLAVEDAVRIAKEVADALQYAHEHGVIHRDIKPENILLQGGHALVADFGIALAAVNTAKGRITETGMSLGTPTYMSPEQAMGERVLDARADVYALGCVLYEMLVGEPPFTGATAQQIVARVMTEEPRSLSAQRKSISPAIDAAVAAALEKVAADRPASAAAFAAMLTSGGMTTGQYRHQRARASRITIALGVALLITATVAALGWFRRAPVPAVSRSYVRFPASEQPLLNPFSFSLVPDGSALVYVGPNGTKGTQLWIKQRSELHATPIGGTSGATSVITSPDGKWVAFVADNKLKKVPISGGDAFTLASVACFGALCDAAFDGSAAWLDDGRLIFRTVDVLASVGEAGGNVDTLVTALMTNGISPVFPLALPGSKGFVFTTCTLSCNKASVWAFDLGTRKVSKLVSDAIFTQYLPSGQLLYTDDAGTVHSIAFDVKSLKTSGAASVALAHVASTVSAASNGTLAYLDGDPSPSSSLVLVGLDGREQPVDSGWHANFATLALSPDGKHLAVSQITRTGDQQVLVTTLDGKQAPVPLTVGRGQYTTPAFSADGQRLYITHFFGDSSRFISKRIDGSSAEATLVRGKDWVIESQESRDGDWLVTRGYRGGVRAIYARRIGPRAGADTAERVLVLNEKANFSPALSPDGKWLLYTNEETGRAEVWAVPFPDARGARWQVSAEGGFEPSWSPDGKTIYYVTADQKLASVQVSTSSGFAVTSRKILFDAMPYKRHPTHRAYEVLPDNQHFLMIREGARGVGDLVMVENWPGEVKQGKP